MTEIVEYDFPGGGQEDEDGGDIKTKPSAPWLNRLERADKAGFSNYQNRCTKIEKLYADLEHLANNARDREMQLFWANLEVLKPSIYSRPPVPVVTPRFKDRRPVPRMASELLERTATVNFELEDFDVVMREVRDDLALLSRGSIWLRYEAKSKDNELREKVCIEHKNRRDFAHDPARYWKDVDWVAARAWLTRAEMRKRFLKTSGKAYQDAEFGYVTDDNQNHDGTKKAGVWEIWCKSANRVLWVVPGVDVCLDEDEPHLSLEGFFPCPRPAYGTRQRNSLIPVPDLLFYRDQLEEINEITARISSLTEAVRLRGFYPSGAGEIGDAVQAAVKNQSDNVVLVGVSNWAMIGGGAAADMIVWLPLEKVVAAIQQLISMRQQLISDVYEITGLSDIMRGSTNPNETLGAQTLKSQYGSVRVRDRQEELVRIARDTVRIAAEIMAENFQKRTFLEMSQLDIKSNADVSKEVKPLEDQLKTIMRELQQAQTDPEIQQMVKANPEQAQQIMQQAQQQAQQLQGQIAQAKKQVTIEQILDFLRDERIRPFVLDIETDSTIQPNEDAEKQRRTEFVGALTTVLSQLAPLVQAQPEAAPFAGAVLKFAVAPFRAGRELESTIEEFVDKLQEAAGQGGNPQQEQEQAAQKAEQEAKQADMKLRADEAQLKAKIMQEESQQRMAAVDAENRMKATEGQIRVGLLRAKETADAQAHEQAMQKGELEIEKLRLEVGKKDLEATKAGLEVDKSQVEADAAAAASLAPDAMVMTGEII
ncbi:hypothetical protein [Erwinia amylovora]|uniref:hypothetical protein n=2 Tax=Enterobacterales TaxID=91347 RepID=UPI003D03CE74